MVNCYVHTERRASSTCAICGRGICKECSNWAAGDLYLCPQCWQVNAPDQSANQGQKRSEITTPLMGAWVSRALYYAIAALVAIIGVWYVYTTFITPVVIPPSGLGLPQPHPWAIWGRYKEIITFSAVMFLIVLIAGQLMLRPRPRQSKLVAVESEVKVPVKTLRARPVETHSVILQPEVQPQIPTMRSRPEQSQPLITPPEVQRPSEPRYVYCIYCGNKILASASVCDRCGKSTD